MILKKSTGKTSNSALFDDFPQQSYKAVFLLKKATFTLLRYVFPLQKVNAPDGKILIFDKQSKIDGLVGN